MSHVTCERCGRCERSERIIFLPFSNFYAH